MTTKTKNSAQGLDLQMFVDVARGMGIRSVRHKNYLATSEVLATLGLKIA